MKAQAGDFTLEHGKLMAPALYMQERGNQKLQEALDGKSQSFEIMQQHCKTIEQAIVVYLQTDFAAWKGMMSEHRLYHHTKPAIFDK